MPTRAAARLFLARCAQRTYSPASPLHGDPLILLIHRDLDPETRDRLATCLHREGLDRPETLSQLVAGGRVVELRLSGATPDPDLLSRAAIWPGVQKVIADRSSLPLVETASPTVTVRPVRPSSPTVTIGAGRFVLVAGPCAVEDPDLLVATAQCVRAAGATMLRAGAYKPRTSPYSFQGLGRDGLLLLARVAGDCGLPLVTEVLDPRDVEFVAGHAEMLQIGARSMQNYPLLREVGGSDRPVLLKRGPSATLEEWLGAAEYCLEAGSPGVVLCERGVSSFDPGRRNLLDIAVVPAVQERCALPILVDPSHATGKRSLVLPMAKAAAAAGADGVMIEVHARPENARSDAAQALHLEDLAPLAAQVDTIAKLEGRRFLQVRGDEASDSDARAIPSPERSTTNKQHVTRDSADENGRSVCPAEPSGSPRTT